MKNVQLIRTPDGFRAATQGDQDAIKHYPVGSYCMAEIVKPRNPEFHRLAMSMLRFGFGQWNPPNEAEIDGIPVPVSRSFDKFREDVTIAAGYYTTVARLDGSVGVEAKSLSYSGMEDGEFRQLYTAMREVVWSMMVKQYPNYTEAEFDAAVNEFMRYT